MSNDYLKKLIEEFMSEKVAEIDVVHKKEKEKLRAKIAQLENEKKELAKKELARHREAAKKKKKHIDQQVLKFKQERENYIQEKEIIEKYTEKGINLFLKDKKHRIGDYKGGQIFMWINIYELALIKKLKFIKGEHYTRFIFLLIREYIEKYNKENKEK